MQIDGSKRLFRDIIFGTDRPETATAPEDVGEVDVERGE